MQSKATTVEEYLAELPADRREALQAIRSVILENLPKGIAEGMQYGMIGYLCAAQRVPGRLSLRSPSSRCHSPVWPRRRTTCRSTSCASTATRARGVVPRAWAKTGKKLDMGKSCVRCKKIDDVPLKVHRPGDQAHVRRRSSSSVTSGGGSERNAGSRPVPHVESNYAVCRTAVASCRDRPDSDAGPP